MSDGGPAARVTLEDVLDVFHERDDPAEPLTAPEVAERLNCSRRTALDKLHELADRGDVASKKVGGRSVVWWLPEGPDAGRDGIDPEDPLFAGGPLFSSGTRDGSESVDDVVYGDPHE